MVLDLLAHFDWKRPIYFTHARSQVVIDLGLLDYLQFDGYAYRLVPIKTEYNYSEPNKIGRIDAAYAYDKLMNRFRYGNLADSRVYVDEFIQNSIAAARAREAFARVALEYINIAWDKERLAKEGISQDECFERAEKLLDRGLQVLPVSQIRYTESNITPFIEGYYLLALDEKGDALLKAYRDNLKEYINYYKQFKGEYYDMVADVVADKVEELTGLAVLASDFDRKELATDIVNYYDALRTWYGIGNAVVSNYNLGNYEAADNLLSGYIQKVIDAINANIDSQDESVRKATSKRLGELLDLCDIAIDYNCVKGACDVIAYFYELTYNDYADELMTKYIRNIVGRIDECQNEKESEQRDNKIVAYLDALNNLYVLAHQCKREDIAYYLNQYYRSIGAKDEDLILTEREKK